MIRRSMWQGVLGLLMLAWALDAAVPGAASATGSARWLLLGHTGFVSGDPTLTLTMPFVLQPSLSITSSAAGDLKWVVVNVPVEFPDSDPPPIIDAVGICYKAPNSGTFISQIRLAEVLGPSGALVKHDDGTDLTSPTDTCFLSAVANYAPAGTVNLELRLNFGASGDKIWIGAVGVHFKQ